MTSEPIAIVGQGCVLPGGLGSDELWTTVHEGRDVLGSPQPGYWGVSPAKVLRDQQDGARLDRAWSDRGGYVRGFAEAFDPHGLLIDPAQLAGLDPLYLWIIEAARQAVDSAGWHACEVPGSAGVVLANLSYPTQTMMRLAESFWRGAEDGIDWHNRFTSGLPAQLMAQALGLTGGAFALDAACASSLYAIKLACDRLHDRTADVMVAGGANGASDVFLHMGFSALEALSRSGRSRPFHRGADGLVPAEGAAMLVLRRLDDAVAEGNPILGVIRAVSLTNNGRGEQVAGDAAVVLVLKRAEDARRDADTILGILPADQEPRGECLALGNGAGAVDVSPLLGHAHAASGLLSVAAGLLYGVLGVRPDGTPWTAEHRAVVITLRGSAGQEHQIVVLSPEHDNADAARRAVLSAPRRDGSARLHFPSHLPAVVLPAGATHTQPEPHMPTRLPVPPALPRVEDALARTPLGAALVHRTPPNPLSTDQDRGAAEPESTPVLEVDGFRFDEAAMAAWANGKPSLAFGPRYRSFDDHRRMIRLPGPPLSFMSRVTEVAGDMGVMESGAVAVAEYDVPSDAWYFAADGRPTMPHAVLMETALQPCGWLAAYIGCPLTSEVDLYFRNLDGTGVQHAEVTPQVGTLRTTVTLKSVAKAGSTIIVSFNATTHAGDELVYTVDTVFGFFPHEALEQQVGLPVTDEQRSALKLPCDAPVIDLRTRPGRFFGPGPRLADPMLLMIDRVTGRWPTGGNAGLGRWQAVKDVDPTEWYFQAHFHQDPVQPGSLGIEALLELLKFAMLDGGLGAEAGPSAHFEPVALQEPLTWRYRGQVLPANQLITSLVEITRVERDDKGILAVADASLWVDGIRIYNATNLAARINFAAQVPRATSVETVIDPARDTWITDHCPTHTSPTLPMTSVLDLFAQAAGRASGGLKVVDVTDLRVDRWIIVDSPKKLRVTVKPVKNGRWTARLEVWRDAPNPVLSRWETHAQATIGTADQYADGGAVPTAPPLPDTVPLADPYETGAVFHGPAFFSVMEGARISSTGASGRLSVHRCTVPMGLVHPGLLDGAMHLVPAGALSVWTTPGTDVESYSEARDTDVALPHRVASARFYRDAPMEGEVDVDARFVGFDDADGRMPVIDVWLLVAGELWAVLRVVGILLPKGPLGQAGPAERRAFLGERRAVPAMSLSENLGQGVVMLDSARVATMDWFRRTLQSAYRTDSRGDALTVEIATKEAVAQAAHYAIHPSQVQLVDGRVQCPALPLERISIEVKPMRPGQFRASAALHTDWQDVRTWWTDRLGMQQGWFGDLLKWSLLSRYVRHVIVTDPVALSAVRGRPVLMLANHQLTIESILATVIGSWLTNTRLVPIAGIKLQANWVGQLTRCLDTEAGRDLGIMRYFDQQTPQQFFGLIEEIKRDTAAHGVSTLVHPDGTRYFRSGQRVEKLTSTLLDMAIEMSLPIVPLHFSGGLPENVVDPKLEVPYRHAAQDYIFGRPIMPDELGGLPYAHRRRHVMDAINELAPFSDAPHEPNVAVENRIDAIRPGASPLESIWDCIEDALDGLPVDWRSTIRSEDWLAARSPLAPHSG